MTRAPIVATNEGTLPLANTTPFSSPQAEPTMTAGMMAAMPSVVDVPAAATAARATIEPTDRSMDPAIMTKVIPNAVTSKTTVCCRIIAPLSRLKNRCDMMLKTAHNTTNTMIGK